MLPEKNDNRIKVDEKKPETTGYFLAVSGRFKTAKYITFVILFVFVLTMATVFRSEITMDNLKFLFKDFEIGNNMIKEGTADIAFESDKTSKVKYFKGDLVIYGTSRYYLCDLQGNTRFDERNIYSKPVVTTSDKYMLMYGIGENTYSIYNTFSQIYTETMNYPITSATVSDSGAYAIVSRSAEYRSAIYIYNKNFENIGVLYKDKYVMDIKFNSEGSELMIVSAYSADGGYCTEVSTYVPKSKQEVYSEVIRDYVPITSSYNSDGGYNVVCDGCVLFFDTELILRNKYSFGTSIPLSAVTSSNYTAVTFSENISGDKIRIVILDKSGTVIVDKKIDGNSKSVRIESGFVYILNDNNICRIDPSDGVIDYVKISSNALNFVPFDEKLMVVCYSDHVSKYSFNEK